MAGEVEDYQVIVLPSVPVAVPDVFPLPASRSSKRTRSIIRSTCCATIRRPCLDRRRSCRAASQLVLPGTRQHADAERRRRSHLVHGGAECRSSNPQQETFTYRVTDGRSVSEPGLVIINVSLADPIALDDTFTLPASDSSTVDHSSRRHAERFVPERRYAGDRRGSFRRLSASRRTRRRSSSGRIRS